MCQQLNTSNSRSLRLVPSFASSIFSVLLPGAIRINHFSSTACGPECVSTKCHSIITSQSNSVSF